VITPGDAEGRKDPTLKKKFMRGLAVTLPGIVEKVIPPINLRGKRKPDRYRRCGSPFNAKFRVDNL